MSERTKHQQAMLRALDGPARITPGPPHQWQRWYRQAEQRVRREEIGAPTSTVFAAGIAAVGVTRMRGTGWCV